MKKKIILILFSLTISFSCNNNEENESKITQAKITLKDQNGNLLQSKTIFVHVFNFRTDGNYSYSSDTEIEGIKTNELGIAFFENLEYSNTFKTNVEETVFGFNTFNGNNNKKLEVKFKKGEIKEFEMIIN